MVSHKPLHSKISEIRPTLSQQFDKIEQYMCEHVNVHYQQLQRVEHIIDATFKADTDLSKLTMNHMNNPSFNKQSVKKDTQLVNPEKKLCHSVVHKKRFWFPLPGDTSDGSITPRSAPIKPNQLSSLLGSMKIKITGAEKYIFRPELEL